MSRILAQPDRLKEFRDWMEQSFMSIESAADDGKRILVDTLSILQNKLKEAEKQRNNAREILLDAEENYRKVQEETAAQQSSSQPGENTAQNTADRLLENAREAYEEKEKKLEHILEVTKKYRDYQDKYQREQERILGEYKRLIRKSNTFFDDYIELLNKAWGAISIDMPSTGASSGSRNDSNPGMDPSEEKVPQTGKQGNRNEFLTVNDLDDETFGLIRDYTTDAAQFNDLMRNNKTTKKLERFREIIAEHSVKEEKTFFRKATLDDLGGKWAGLPIEKLTGKCYQFQGILSASTGYEMGRGDVEFEIRVPAGTPALDLTQMYFNEAIFDSPLCYIEKAYKDQGRTHIVIRVYSSKAYHQAVDRLKKRSVTHRPIEYCNHQRTSTDIVRDLSGGDRTKGSCSSLALAYAGNQQGYDVLDFRGGNSRLLFSHRSFIATVASLPGVWSRMQEMRDDIKNTHILLEQMRPDRTYYLATGSHAAVVRKTDSHYEYLELQNGTASKNTWHLLTDEKLSERFKCNSHRVKKKASFLIDTESLGKSKEFQDILGYINTAESEQRKGVSGYAR